MVILEERSNKLEYDGLKLSITFCANARYLHIVIGNLYKSSLWLVPIVEVSL